MALSSTHKDQATLTYIEDRENLQLVGRQMLRRFLNEAVEDLRKRHLTAQDEGRIDRVLPNREDVEKHLYATLRRQLPAGDDVQD
jgi:hypothetical protein